MSNRCAHSVSTTVTALLTNTSQSISSAPTSIAPNTTHQLIHFPSSLRVAHARLWWPNGYGAQPLYALRVSASADGLVESDVAWAEFGVREVDTFIDTTTGGRVFTVNSQPIYIRGGNWISTDQMFRYATDPHRYSAEVRAHAQMGLNLIRVWGGGVSERDEFYRACDREGVLVMQGSLVA